jgi:hypothetical protein
MEAMTRNGAEAQQEKNLIKTIQGQVQIQLWSVSVVWTW